MATETETRFPVTLWHNGIARFFDDETGVAIYCFGSTGLSALQVKQPAVSSERLEDAKLLSYPDLRKGFEGKTLKFERTYDRELQVIVYRRLAGSQWFSEDLASLRINFEFRIGGHMM